MGNGRRIYHRSPRIAHCGSNGNHFPGLGNTLCDLEEKEKGGIRKMWYVAAFVGGAVFGAAVGVLVMSLKAIASKEDENCGGRP